MIGLSHQTRAENKTAPEPVNIVNSFHEALSTGNKNSVLELLSHDLIVIENGHIETSEEYISHHLDADLAFSTEVNNQHTLIKARNSVETAWLVSRSHARGTFHDKNVNSIGAELIILEKQSGIWKITAIHWSSRKH